MNCQMLNLWTGHSCCHSCMDKLFSSGKARCFFHCKGIRRSHEVYQIYVDLVDSKVAESARVVEKIGEMDDNAKLVSVDKTATKIQAMAEALQECDNDRAVSPRLSRGFPTAHKTHDV